MKSHSTNFASEPETAQVLQTDLLPDSDLRPVSRVSNSNSSPLWLSTTGYFLIALTVSLGLFFVFWGLLHDEGEYETPWIPAGIAIAVMSLATAAREVVLRRARTRYLLSQEQFVPPAIAPQRVKTKTEKKFTLEQNSAALRLIKRKADEADLTLATAEEHLEVFKASQEYLEIVRNELQKVQAGSPRLPALRRGIKTVEVLHRHHLLQWAAEETHRLMREAKILVLTDEKILTAHRAIEALDFALRFYPDETQLLSSRTAVHEFTVSIRITHWIELAERDAFKGHYRRAVDHYQDALFYLSREPLHIQENDFIKTKLEDEIEKLNIILSSKKGARKKLSPEK